ncbi:alpha-1,2-glucosyltransferase Alg10 isoform X2 [Rhynchophorus ferrugineus]|uniref:alpha-1,2-glucosyltransferase Alg10 isoform X2 n=1 Tax=Rhynchophorus ferrugineus TaxID=354439 RepID=UPI003FCDEBD1
MNITHLLVIASVGVYSILSKSVFDKVFHTSHLIVDEEFHIPLGQQYCRFKFDEWDPKVTTLPGLYLITSLLLGPLNLCSIYWLRFISLLFSCLNIILLYAIFSLHLKKEWQNILSAITVVLLPPLYFFSHIYYTDIVSLTSILLLIFLNELGFHYFAAIAGFFSILCRQTNVIFLAVYAGKYILNELYAIWVNKNFKYKKFGELPAKVTYFYICCTITY